VKRRNKPSIRIGYQRATGLRPGIWEDFKILKDHKNGSMQGQWSEGPAGGFLVHRTTSGPPFDLGGPACKVGKRKRTLKGGTRSPRARNDSLRLAGSAVYNPVVGYLAIDGHALLVETEFFHLIQQGLIIDFQ
jgi:hypothetical protein